MSVGRETGNRRDKRHCFRESFADSWAMRRFLSHQHAGLADIMISPRHGNWIVINLWLNFRFPFEPRCCSSSEPNKNPGIAAGVLHFRNRLKRNGLA
jgi:hypothetical protein